MEFRIKKGVFVNPSVIRKLGEGLNKIPTYKREHANARDILMLPAVISTIPTSRERRNLWLDFSVSRSTLSLGILRNDKPLVCHSRL